MTSAAPFVQYGVLPIPPGQTTDGRAWECAVGKRTTKKRAKRATRSGSATRKSTAPSRKKASPSRKKVASGPGGAAAPKRKAVDSSARSSRGGNKRRAAEPSSGRGQAAQRATAASDPATSAPGGSDPAGSPPVDSTPTDATSAAEPTTTRRRRKLKTPLSARELREFKALLLTKRSELVADVDNLTQEALGGNQRDRSASLSSMPIHMADLGSDNWEQEFTLGLIANEKILLREIDDALDRIADRTYGVCMGTGEPIGLTRLRAQPWAKYGIEYARKQDGFRGR